MSIGFILGSNTLPDLDFELSLGNNLPVRMPQKSSDRKKLTREKARDLDVKIEFVEGIVRRDPDYFEALQLLGDHYTERGRFQEGLKVDEQLARLDPRNPLVYYNLACSYSLTDNLSDALSALDKAISYGYRDFKWLAKDPDLRKLRKHPSYQNIKEKIRKMKINVG